MILTMRGELHGPFQGLLAALAARIEQVTNTKPAKRNAWVPPLSWPDGAGLVYLFLAVGLSLGEHEHAGLQFGRAPQGRLK